MPESQEKSQHRVWQVVNAIPLGKVATYGQVARLAGMPAHARLVGRILARLPAGTRLPWHRVVASQGRITHPGGTRQRKRLRAEGVTFTASGNVSLRRHGWDV